MERIDFRISQRLWHRVYTATQRIPRGRVATYADLARAVGRPRAWRYVGTVMGRNRDPSIPCHRVVRSDGRVGGFSAGGRTGGTREKIARLQSDGVVVRGQRIDLARFRIRSLGILGIKR